MYVKKKIILCLHFYCQDLLDRMPSSLDVVPHVQNMAPDGPNAVPGKPDEDGPSTSRKRRTENMESSTKR